MGIFRRAREAEPPQQVADADGPFRLVVEDVFMITGRGVVVTGRVESGSVAVGAMLRLAQVDGSEVRVEVTGIEAFRKRLDTAVAGQNVGLLLGGVAREGVVRGDVLIR